MACGFSVGIMWPGSISLSSGSIPNGGTALFALLALAGDVGGTLGPAVVGNVSEIFGGDLHTGILASIGFPLCLVICVLLIARSEKRAAK